MKKGGLRWTELLSRERRGSGRRERGIATDVDEAFRFRSRVTSGSRDWASDKTGCASRDSCAKRNEDGMGRRDGFHDGDAGLTADERALRRVKRFDWGFVLADVATIEEGRGEG